MWVTTGGYEGTFDSFMTATGRLMNKKQITKNTRQLSGGQ